MSWRRIYRSYVDFFEGRTPLYRWAIPQISAGMLFLLAAGSLHFVIGDHWTTVTLAIIGFSLVSNLCLMVRRPWRQKETRPESNREMP